MPEFTHSETYQVLWLVRRLFRALGQKSNEILEVFGITAADRAVMEFLYRDEKLSVPEIAERYQVSRQHVQATVNHLLERELVTTRKNPRHKRSPHIALNAKGRHLFAEILKQDEVVVQELFSRMSSQDIRITRTTLQSLLQALEGA